MSDSIRAFLAIELPPQVKDALASLVEEIGRADIPGLRLVRPEGIHLTLKFLGDVPVDQVDSIVAALSQIAGEHRPFTLRLGGVGVFPNRSSARVLWVGVEGEITPVLSLQRQIETALAALGFPRERRRFSPHLTVGRIRDGTSRADRRRAAEALCSAQLEPGLRIVGDSAVLMRSILLPSGAVYERLASAPLSGESHEELG